MNEARSGPSRRSGEAAGPVGGRESAHKPHPGLALAVRRGRWVTRVMEELIPIPGTRRRIGLDPLLGLVPGLGDALGFVVSLHLLVAAARGGVGAALLTRMFANILLDAVVGAVPIAGDAFDVVWRANGRNLRLLEAFVADPQRARRRSRWLVGGVLGAALGCAGLAVWAGWRLLVQIVGAF